MPNTPYVGEDEFSLWPSTDGYEHLEPDAVQDFPDPHPSEGDFSPSDDYESDIEPEPEQVDYSPEGLAEVYETGFYSEYRFWHRDYISPGKRSKIRTRLV